MKAFRISLCKYIEDLTGEGAFRASGRWNSKGVRMLYASTSISLSTLEILVHTDGLPLKTNKCIINLIVPDEDIFILASTQLPKDWDCRPANQSTRSIGDKFIKDGKHLAMIVPSVIIPEEQNLLINPNHPNFDKIEISEKRVYIFDNRL